MCRISNADKNNDEGGTDLDESIPIFDLAYELLLLFASSVHGPSLHADLEDEHISLLCIFQERPPWSGRRKIWGLLIFIIMMPDMPMWSRPEGTSLPDRAASTAQGR